MAVNIGTIYRDLSYQPKLAHNGDVNVVENLVAVKQSIMTIFNTPKGSRLFEPDFGMDVRRYLFEPLDGRSSSDLKEEVSTSINRFEPRVTVLGITIGELSDVNGYSIEVRYRFNEVNATDSVTVNLQRL
jgi:phage baseplate assembly protein W